MSFSQYKILKVRFFGGNHKGYYGIFLWENILKYKLNNYIEYKLINKMKTNAMIALVVAAATVYMITPSKTWALESQFGAIMTEYRKL